MFKPAGLRRAGELECRASGCGFVIAFKRHVGGASAAQAGIVFCCALIFLAGCATQPVPPSEVISGSGPLMNSSLNWTNPAATNLFPPPVQPVPSPVRPVTPPIVIPKPPKPAPPVTTWSSLAGWAAAHGLGAPRKLSSQPVAEYAITSRYGVMVLGIGSREATWNGIVINLGFAPENIDGEVWLHGLDLEKNLEPLLCEPPLVFGANRIIVIDPGHGGSNPGASSVLDGRLEKEFTLDTALRLKPLLEAEGWTVFLTRSSDVYVSNLFRPFFTTAHRADLFISLHFNSAAPDRKQGGLETYCFTPTGMPSTITREYSDPWSEKSSSNDFDAQDLQLAVKVQGALLRATGMGDRGVRRVRYIEVLRGQQCPAVLLENGYLSNPGEAALIESPEYRQRLAQAIADGLK